MLSYDVEKMARATTEIVGDTPCGTGGLRAGVEIFAVNPSIGGGHILREIELLADR